MWWGVCTLPCIHKYTEKRIQESHNISFATLYTYEMGGFFATHPAARSCLCPSRPTRPSCDMPLGVALGPLHELSLTVFHTLLRSDTLCHERQMFLLAMSEVVNHTCSHNDLDHVTIPSCHIQPMIELHLLLNTLFCALCKGGVLWVSFPSLKRTTPFVSHNI